MPATQVNRPDLAHALCIHARATSTNEDLLHGALHCVLQDSQTQGGPALELAHALLALLEVRTAGGDPGARNQIPGAQVPGHPEVQAFLRGCEKDMR
jgi:hypothetical protein